MSPSLIHSFRLININYKRVHIKLCQLFYGILLYSCTRARHVRPLGWEFAHFRASPLGGGGCGRTCTFLKRKIVEEPPFVRCQRRELHFWKCQLHKWTHQLNHFELVKALMTWWYIVCKRRVEGKGRSPRPNHPICSNIYAWFSIQCNFITLKSLRWWW